MLFGYICEECQTGIIKDKIIKKYKINFYEEEFIVNNAIIGVCDHCGAINLAGEELHRWEQEYKKQFNKKARKNEKYN